MSAVIFSLPFCALVAGPVNGFPCNWSLNDDELTRGINQTIANPPDGAPEIPEILWPSTIFGAAQSTLSIPTSTAGIILIIAGVFFCFFGRKMLKPTLFVTGFYVGGILTYICLAAIQARIGGSFGPGAEYIYLFVCFAVGLILAIIFAKFVVVGCICLAIAVGYTAATLLLAAGLNIFMNHTGTVLFVIFCMVGCAVAVFFLENWIVLIGTALLGAFTLATGIDFFLRSGFNQISVRIWTSLGLTCREGPVVELKDVSDVAWGLMGGVVLVAVIGIIVQIRPPSVPHVGQCPDVPKAKLPGTKERAVVHRQSSSSATL
ncbi:hypothetical protein BJ742DRAFT_899279 [Cladochytrium replicatum]|nr:hypothetical protein BJ742DRAFT_899279 [Cladochytrium replicatum]